LRGPRRHPPRGDQLPAGAPRSPRSLASRERTRLHHQQHGDARSRRVSQVRARFFSDVPAFWRNGARGTGRSATARRRVALFAHGAAAHAFGNASECLEQFAAVPGDREASLQGNRQQRSDAARLPDARVTVQYAWPFFEDAHREFAKQFAGWAEALRGFESDDGGDGRAAREIFARLGQAGWLRPTIEPAPDGRIDLRRVALMRELLGYSSAIADVAFSEPWLGALPIALHGSDVQRAVHLDGYAAGTRLPAFALSEPEAGSDV